VHLDAPERGAQRLFQPRVAGDVVDEQAQAVLEGGVPGGDVRIHQRKRLETGRRKSDLRGEP
jgi:hypothetical protein